MEYKHFSKNEKESNFSKLSGNIQQAIETQANIDVEAHKLSRFYKAAMSKEGVEQDLFNMLCEEYAIKSDEELKRLVIIESKIGYYFPLKEDRFRHYEYLAKERAAKMDKEIFIQTRDNFKDFSR